MLLYADIKLCFIIISKKTSKFENIFFLFFIYCIFCIGNKYKWKTKRIYIFRYEKKKIINLINVKKKYVCY